MSKNNAKWDERYLAVAQLIAGWSKDPSTKVGAVLVTKDNRIAATGFNGFPPGADDSPALYADRYYKYRHVIHAEANALNTVSNATARGGTLYTSFPPCPDCVQRAALAGVRRIVCRPLPTRGRTLEWVAEWTARLKKAGRVARSLGVDLVERPTGE